MTIAWFARPAAPFEPDDVVIALAAGRGDILAVNPPAGFHVCALTSRGEVRCFGDNRKGQAGTDRAAVVASAVDVAAGGEHTCAVLSDGSVSCWGDNASKQLGAATPTTSSTPLTIAGLAAVIRVRAIIDVDRTAAPTALTATFTAQ